jgi:hypothetical protein
MPFKFALLKKDNNAKWDNTIEVQWEQNPNILIEKKINFILQKGNSFYIF